MQLTRIDDARPYETRGHFNMCGLRLQGYEATETKGFWVGLSHFLPGGGAESSDSNLEKIYIGVSGTVTIVTDEGEFELNALDSCHLEPGERREVINRTNQPAAMLVVMPYPEKAGP